MSPQESDRGGGRSPGMARMAAGRTRPGLTLLVAVALIAAGLGIWHWARVRAAAPVAAARAAPAAADAAAAFRPLVGSWVRADSPYVIEVRSVREGGRADAAYYNPRPIHVARAQAREAAGRVELFVELQDVNYPGSTYTLTYDPASDLLKGVYYQAMLQESYDVYFGRMR